MEKLADKGNGNYAYLDSLHEARKVLVARGRRDARHRRQGREDPGRVQPAAEVAAYRLIGYENRMLRHQDFNDDKKDAGEIGAGHTVTALYEIVPARRAARERRRRSAEVSASGAKPQCGREVGRADDGQAPLQAARRRHAASSSRSPCATEAGELTPNLGFASAVAEFGMLLRRSEHKGQSTWTSAQELARRYRGEDPDGYRAEFVRLVELASALEAQNLTSPQSRR